ncbi:hypothetical protein NE865_16493 [Phthorimaea operculella]|nr:hypothetical protein NE865_16493 [Phthorimaea operculella]
MTKVKNTWLCVNCTPPKQKRIEKKVNQNNNTPLSASKNANNNNMDCFTPRMLDQISSILDTKLQTFETNFIEKLRTTIKDEVNVAVNTAMATLRSEFTATTDFISAEQKDTKNNLVKIEQKVKALESTNSRLQSEIKTLECRLNNSDIIPLKSQVTQLQTELNSRAQSSLRNELEIAGVMECPNENLHHVALVTARKIGITLEDSDIDWVMRVGAKPKSSPSSTEIGGDSDHEEHEENSSSSGPRPRPVVIRFTRRARRDDFLRSSKLRKDLTNQDIEVGNSTMKIYINKRLTKENRQLFRVTRNRAHEAGYKHCWTNNGTVYVRKADGRFYPAIPIRSMADVDDKMRMDNPNPKNN